MEKIVKGIAPIISTPWTKTDLVDYDSFRHMLRNRAEAGVHAMTLFGIAGEYYKLSDAERREMAKIAAEECRKYNVPIIISTTQHGTIQAVADAKYYESVGADIIMILPPFFMQPSADMIYNHVKAICNAVKIPCMVQYAPAQTGCVIQPDVWIRLAKECPNLQYYKIECKPPGKYISGMMNAMEEKPNVFMGTAGYWMLEGFDRGAIGVMPSMILAEIYLKIWDAYWSGDREAAVEAHNDFLPIYNHMHQTVEMSIYYDHIISQRRGVFETSCVRSPHWNPDPVYDKLFEQYLEPLAEKYHFW